jgi:hypothetical protein
MALFPISSSVAIVGFLEVVIIGLAVGAFSGLLFSIILKQRARGVGIDSFFGLIAFVIALIVEDRFTIMSRFQHPFVMAGIVAVIPPALHQWFRFKGRGAVHN